MKKGLAVFYDPHNVYQFLWYYCTYGKDVEWNALCLPNSYKGEYLSPVCRNLGLFKNIYTDANPFDALPVVKKLSLFVKMFVYALFLQQKRFAKKIISSYIGKVDFDTAVVLTDVGFVSGMFCLFGKEKEIVILEDGVGDYLERKYSNIFSHAHNFFDVQGFVLSVLGYSNVGHYFPLKTTKYCIKFCSHPDKMLYKKYKCMERLFDMTYTDSLEFQRLLEIVYPNINKYFQEKVEVILFSTPLSDYVSDVSPFIVGIEDFVKKNFSSIILKRHPRDKSVYNFGDSVKVKEIDQKIPAEVLLPFIKQTKIFFFANSSINLYMASFDYRPSFFYFDGLLEKNKSERNILSQYMKKDIFIKRLEWFGHEPNIIVIDRSTSLPITTEIY